MIYEFNGIKPVVHETAFIHPQASVTGNVIIGKVSILTFLIASSLGKIPALLIEAYSVYQVTEFGWQGKVILGIIACVLVKLLLVQASWLLHIKNERANLLAAAWYYNDYQN